MPSFSPDGEWLAYVSDESGESEIYVVSYPGKERTIAISKGGGRGPLWSADGKELFYRDLEGGRLYTVPVESGAEPSFGEPRLLFEGSSAFALYAGTNYDVSADGQTFYLVREIVTPSLNLVVNWFTELEQRAPRNKKGDRSSFSYWLF